MESQGHQATTCNDNASLCPGSAFISIAVPCPQAYMNEAYNSWLMNAYDGPDAGWDPYGECA